MWCGDAELGTWSLVNRGMDYLEFCDLGVINNGTLVQNLVLMELWNLDIDLSAP